MARLHVLVGKRMARAATALCLLAAPEAGATSLALYPDPTGAMKAGELRQTVTGLELQGSYPADGAEWSEAYRPDGTLTYRDTATRTGGRWLISGGRFCTDYDAASLQDACFLVRQRGENCYDFYEVDEKFRSTVPLADVRNGVNFSARAWRQGEVSTCPTSAEALGAGSE